MRTFMTKLRLWKITLNLKVQSFIILLNIQECINIVLCKFNKVKFAECSTTRIIIASYRCRSKSMKFENRICSHGFYYDFAESKNEETSFDFISTTWVSLNMHIVFSTSNIRHWVEEAHLGTYNMIQYWLNEFRRKAKRMFMTNS